MPDHDWHKMLREGEMRHDDHHLFDDIDIRNARNGGLFVGICGGVLFTVILCLVLGFWANNWHLPY